MIPASNNEIRIHNPAVVSSKAYHCVYRVYHKFSEKIAAWLRNQNRSTTRRITSRITMNNLLGLLKVRVRRGIKLAVRDTLSSDPYVVITMGSQRLKTRVVKDNCNPVWNDELTLSVKNLDETIKLKVYDHDTFTQDDKMGEAIIDLKPYVEAVRMDLKDLPVGTTIDRVQPTNRNYLAEESSIVWDKGGKITQDMLLKLKKVECGQIDIQIEWVNLPGRKGLLP